MLLSPAFVSSGVRGALTPGIKRSGSESGHSSPSSAEVKNTWNYTSTPAISLHLQPLNVINMYNLSFSTNCISDNVLYNQT
jgi:hypothetical protein